MIIATLLFADATPQVDIERSDDTWRLERTNFYFENDIFLKTDTQYTAGWKLSNVYFLPHVDSDLLKIPFLFDTKKAHFISVALAQQIYTPEDLNVSEVIVNDRPYAGWLYVEIGLHQSSKDELDSLSLQLGVVGKLSGGEAVQKGSHHILGSEAPKGWSHQLSNEVGLNLSYQHKWRFVPDDFFSMSSNIIPFVGGTLGNVRTEATGGFLMRIGLNPIEDFGSSSIDVGGENAIPIRANCLCSEARQWSFTFNLSASLKAVAHDIFLDGNTFKKSHSVEKENFIMYNSLGFSARYEHYAFDYIVTVSTQHFSARNSDYKFGTLLFSYLY